MKALVSLVLCLAATVANATDLTTDVPYGVNLAPLLAPLWKNPNAANVVQRIVAPNISAVMDSTSVVLNSVPYTSPITFTGSKTAGNGTTSLDTWNGTATTGEKATLWRNGEGLTGTFELANGLVINVVRFNSQGHGAYVIRKLPAQQTWGVIEPGDPVK